MVYGIPRIVRVNPSSGSGGGTAKRIGEQLLLGNIVKKKTLSKQTMKDINFLVSELYEDYRTDIKTHKHDMRTLTSMFAKAIVVIMENVAGENPTLPRKTLAKQLAKIGEAIGGDVSENSFALYSHWKETGIFNDKIIGEKAASYARIGRKLAWSHEIVLWRNKSVSFVGLGEKVDLHFESIKEELLPNGAKQTLKRKITVDLDAPEDTVKEFMKEEMVKMALTILNYEYHPVVRQKEKVLVG